MQKTATFTDRSMKRWFAILFSAIAAFAAGVVVPSAGNAQQVQRIAAIVNDDVVSQYDLQARMHVVIASSGIRPTARIQQQIGQQVLRNLIDERLQLQEAKKRNITVTSRDMKSAIERIEKQNKIPPGSFDDFLKKNRLPRESILSQVRAEIAWSKLIRRVLIPRVTVGDDEVEDVLTLLKQRKGETEYRVSEIFLTIDNPSQEQEVQRTARRLVDELRKGANFQSVARQFSQTASASVGGDLGWLREATMNDDFRKTVTSLKEGEIAEPIAVPGGVHILALRDKRRVLTGNPDDTVLELQQILLPVSGKAGIDAVNTQVNLARLLSETVSGCEDHLRAAAEANSAGSPKLGKVRLGSLSAKVKAAVADIPVGKASLPVRTDQGIAVFMVCNRKEPEGNLPARQQIEEQLRQQRVSVLARQYLRDLRAAAIVDLRV